MTSVNDDVVTGALHGLYERLRAYDQGAVATYIPELSTATPTQFGVALVSIEGHAYDAGDASVPFTIQSVSKPFVYALALADRGIDEVSAHVGVEPSGEPFNAISLEPQTGRPANPMINAGAIITGSLIKAADARERFERIRSTLSRFAGQLLDLDERVYASELETGDRNRALAYLMRNAGLLESPVDDAIDVYFRQCALRVTAHDLAVMGATLANGGVNPCTGVVVVEPNIAQHVLSVMTTCGMYDYSGEWLFRIGLPAKSGVSGGVVAVSPAQFGLGLFSPPLDERGNSVRAIAACRELSDRYQLHLLHSRGRLASAIYRSGPATTVSCRVRRQRERDLLRTHSSFIHVLALQGDIEFTAAEQILWSLARLPKSHREGFGWLALDLLRVTRIGPVAAALLTEALRNPALHRSTIVVANAACASLGNGFAQTSDIGDALEWCEDALLEREGAAPNAEDVLPLDEHDVMAPLDSDARHHTAEALSPCRRQTGDLVFDDAETVLGLVVAGRVGLYARDVQDPSARRRVAAFGRGTAYARTIDAGNMRHEFVAEMPTSVMVMTRNGLARLERTAPRVLANLWQSMTAFVTGTHLDWRAPATLDAQTQLTDKGSTSP